MKKHGFSYCLRKSTVFFTFLNLKNSNTTIVSPNASRARRRYYSKPKCTSTSRAQTLIVIHLYGGDVFRSIFFWWVGTSVFRFAAAIYAQGVAVLAHLCVPVVSMEGGSYWAHRLRSCSIGGGGRHQPQGACDSGGTSAMDLFMRGIVWGGRRVARVHRFHWNCYKIRW